MTIPWRKLWTLGSLAVDFFRWRQRQAQTAPPPPAAAPPPPVVDEDDGA